LDLCEDQGEAPEKPMDYHHLVGGLEHILFFHAVGKNNPN
jgi:hypothetical protein